MAKSKQSQKGPGTRAVATLLVVGLLGIAAIAAYIKLTPADRIPNDLRKSTAQGVTDPERPKDGHIQIIKPSAHGVDVQYGRENTALPDDKEAIVTAVNGFLDGCPFLPSDARALSATVKDHIADVDFAASFEKSYGTTDEATLLKGLQMSVGQFKGIDKVILTVGGRPIDSLGNVELTNGISVIRKDGSETSTPDAAKP